MVAPDAPTIARPAWYRGLAINQWTTIAGTALSQSDIAPQIAAGLAGPDGSDIGFGRPRKGIMDFSGGTLKRAGSEMLIFGGGGAGAWAGNDVRGLRLEDDRPTWRTRVKPTHASFVHSRHAAGQTPHPYLLNGDPNARHSYYQPQFDDATDRFFALGCQNVWEVDQGTFNNVDSAALDASWYGPKSHPDLPLRRVFDGSWTCRHSVTGVMYAAGESGIASFDPSRNSWTKLYEGQVGGIDRGAAAIDPGRNLLLRLGRWGARARVPLVLDLATRSVTIGSLVGPHEGSIHAYSSAALVWDARLAAFVYFQDDGFLYTIALDRNGRCLIDRITLTGTPPAAGASTVHSGGACAIWGRMQYVPNLNGVCILQRYDVPAYFVRTA